MRLFLFYLFILLAGAAPAQILIRNTTVVDIENKKLIAGQDVLIDNGTINAIGKNLSSPATQTIDGSGKYLMPGLVDAHIHFFQSGGIYTRPDAIDLRSMRSYKTETDWVHKNMENFLRRYLRAGITTVIDVGSNIHFLQQRDSFKNKNYSPSIFMTGPLLTTWEPGAFKNIGNEEPFFEMKTVEQAREYVKKQLPYRPDFIKIWYIVLGRNVDSSARASLPMVKAAIEEAHRNGLRVAVHATERITAKLSVEAGADFLVHSVDDEHIDDAFVKLLRNNKTVLSPTLVVESNYNKAFGQSYGVSSHDYKYAHPKPLNSLFDMKAVDTVISNRYLNYVRSKNAITAAQQKDSIMRSNLRKLSDGGVTIATGTDAGNIGTQHVSSYYDELKAMSESGLDMWQLLQASTINGAKAVGKESEFGTVAIGKKANMILLNSNPLENLSNWQNVEWVINKGELIKPGSLVQPTPEELADQQLLAYNAHNLEAFLAPYAEDVEIYGAANKLQMKGKEEMRKAYKFLNSTPKLYCRLLNRIVQGNIVVDHEEVWGFGKDPFYGIAIYEIKDGKISKVYFPD